MSTDTREALAAMPTDAQVVAAARVLNKRAAEACNVDEEDSWKTYGEEYKDDAREALRAALATQPAQPSRAQKMREAGFTARDTRLTCDECGAKFTQQFAPLHECAQPAQPSAQGEAVAFEGLTKEEVNAIWWAHNEEPTPTFRFSVTQDIASALARRWLASAPAAPAQAVPLTDEHISALWMSGWGAYCSRTSFIAIFREAERAHGIKAAP